MQPVSTPVTVCGDIHGQVRYDGEKSNVRGAHYICQPLVPCTDIEGVEVRGWRLQKIAESLQQNLSLASLYGS